MLPTQIATREPLVEPTWEIAHLFPSQGAWSEEEYLALETNHQITDPSTHDKGRIDP